MRYDPDSWANKGLSIDEGSLLLNLFMDWSLSEGLMHKGIIRLLKGVFMSIEDVVNVLKDAGFCGDEHTLFKEDVSISVRYSTSVIA